MDVEQAKLEVEAERGVVMGMREELSNIRKDQVSSRSPSPARQPRPRPRVRTQCSGGAFTG